MPLHALRAAVVALIIAGAAGLTAGRGNEGAWERRAEAAGSVGGAQGWTGNVQKSLDLRTLKQENQENLNEELYEAARSTDGTGARRVLDLVDRGASKDTCCDIFGNTPLHIAASRNNPEVVAAFLGEGFDPEPRNTNNDTPLHLAARENALEAARELVNFGVDVDVQNSDGYTPLHFAAEGGATKIVRLLVDNGADAGILNEDGRSPSDVACLLNCQRGAKKKINAALGEDTGGEPPPMALPDSDNPLDKELIALAALAPNSSSRANAERLLADGAVADACCTESGGTALHATVRVDNDVVAAVLIAEGADVNAIDDGQDTVLHIVSLYNAVKVAELVLAEDPNIDPIDSQGETPLHHAAEFGSLEISRMLIEAGASLTIKSNDGETPEDLICEVPCDAETQAALVELFKQAVATPTARKLPTREPSKENPELSAVLLDLAEARPNDTSGALARELIEGGASANACCTASGAFALHATLRHDNVPVAKVLIESGADLNAVDQTQDTALHTAPFWNSLEVATLIVDAGAELDLVDDIGETALHHAAEFGNVGIARLLLEAGADASIRNQEGDIAAELICSFTCPPEDESELKQLFKQAGGVEVDQEKTLDQQLVDLAESSPSPGINETAQELLDRGASPDACCSSLDSSALHACAVADNNPVARVLVRAGANVSITDRLGDTPLHSVPINNAVDVAQVLVEAGAPLDRKDDIEETPLHRAAAYGRVVLVELLVRAGANTTIPNADGETPRDQACTILACTEPAKQRLEDLLPDTSPQETKESEKEQIEEEVIEMKMKEGQPVPSPKPGKPGKTPNKLDMGLLELADTRINGSTRSSVMKILSKGADPNACCGTFGGAALHITSNFDNYIVAEALIEAKAKIDVRDDIRDTPLHDAAIVNASRVAMLLLDAGAEVDALDDLDETPLHHAVEWGSLAVARQLVERGADAGAKSKEGLTPLDVVCKNICLGDDKKKFEELLSSSPSPSPSEDEVTFVSLPPPTSPPNENGGPGAAGGR